jgi:hypothetical protein
MAYNNFYSPYQNAYNPYQQSQPNFQQQLGFQQSQPNIQQPQIQNGGFVSVRSAQEAFNYPVALGNSVTFKDETAPYIYVKTRGFSQLEEPIFEQFKLVKVGSTENQTNNEKIDITDKEEYVSKSEFEALKNELDTIKKKVFGIKLEENESEGIT